METSMLKIGELAKRTGSPIETVRFYEREGLLPEPKRSTANYRLYGPAHVEQLQFIRHCRSLDMTLSEIRRLIEIRSMPDGSCAAVNALVEKHLRHVGDRIRELQELQRQLTELRGRCHTVQTARECEILQTLAT